jgi:predicted O-linked N-acetylglucosamine transferase (SPINDLY family)
VCWEGDKWYNRIGPEMLRRAGLVECVARDEESYIALARRMITDGVWRAELRARLETADLDATIYGREEGTHFATAMEYLLDHHRRLQAEGGREPIRIGKAGMAGNGPLSG